MAEEFKWARPEPIDFGPYEAYMSHLEADNERLRMALTVVAQLDGSESAVLMSVRGIAQHALENTA